MPGNSPPDRQFSTGGPACGLADRGRRRRRGEPASSPVSRAFFEGERLVGLLYSKGKDGIGIKRVERIGDHLRVWDD
jgi:hypothetical protein